MWSRSISRVSKRALSISSIKNAKAAYEGEGKTTAKVINQEYELGLMINAFANYGFRLNNGITILGPMAIFSRTVMSWQVASSDQITAESLRLFKILEPKIDIVIIGLETNDRSVMTNVFRAAKENGLNTEILSTEHACSTYNFLCAEGRSVAAALIPPVIVSMNEDDHLEAGIHYGEMYTKELK